MKHAFILVAFFLAVRFGYGQELVSYSSVNNSGCSGIVASDTNVSTTGMCRGSGIVYKSGATYNSKNWTTGVTIDSNDYVEWTLTPNSGYSMDLSTLDMAYSRNSQGPTQAELQIDTGSGFTTVFSDTAVTTATEFQTGIDLSAYINLTGTVTFRFFGFDAGGNSGTLSIDQHSATNKGVIVNGTISAIPCSDITWNGNNWIGGLPDSSTNVTIQGNFDSGNGGDESSFTACSLIVNANRTLTIADNTYIEIEKDITVNGSIVVESQGALVQNDANAVISMGVGATTSLTKESSSLGNWYEYTYWSSPVIGASIASTFSNTPVDRRFWFNAQNYLDETKETDNDNASKNGQDDIDDNGDDWQLATGNMTPGVGYAATSSDSGVFPRTDQVSFSGEFNTGDIQVPIYKNDAESNDNNWNLIGNPYPSAISADAFFTENSGITNGAIYLWSQGVTASRTNNGNEDVNFSQADYAIINLTAETAGGDGIVPNRNIPSGQAFFISYDHNASGTPISPGSDIMESAITFTNSMRAADTNSNDQFFRQGPDQQNNILWLNLSTNTGVFCQMAVGYLEGATNGFDGMAYDAPRNASSEVYAAIYSLIKGDPRKFGIQGKALKSLNIKEVIPFGFQTLIDGRYAYTLSLDKVQGDFLESNVVYLRDKHLDRIHNLTKSSYHFKSYPGEFNRRFELVFQTKSTGKMNTTLQDTLLSLSATKTGETRLKVPDEFHMKHITIFDLLGRQLFAASLDGHEKVIDLTAVSKGPFIARIILNDGQVITKLAVNRE